MPSGTLRKRGSHWYLDIHTGRIIDGQRERIRRRARGFTKKEAQTELDEELFRMRRAEENGQAPDNNYLLSDLRDEWLNSIRLQVKTKKVLSDYQMRVDRLIKWLASRNVKLAENITPRIFEEWQNESLQSFAPRTVRVDHRVFARMLDLGVDRGLIARNPIASVKMVAKKRVKFRRDLRPEEVDALLENSTPAFRSIWYFLLCTGCRLEEMQELRWEAVDLKKKTVRIQAYDDWAPKTDASLRTIPINDDLVSILSDLQPRRASGYVFRTQDGGKRSHNVLRRFKTAMRAALYSIRGIPTRKRLSNQEKERWAEDIEDVKHDLTRLDVHSLRYTFITEMISAGVNPKSVQYLAGHSDIQTTLNIYAQCRPEPVEDAITNLPWKFRVTNPSQKKKAKPKGKKKNARK